MAHVFIECEICFHCMRISSRQVIFQVDMYRQSLIERIHEHATTLAENVLDTGTEVSFAYVLEDGKFFRGKVIAAESGIYRIFIPDIERTVEKTYASLVHADFDIFDDSNWRIAQDSFSINNSQKSIYSTPKENCSIDTGNAQHVMSATQTGHNHISSIREASKFLSKQLNGVISSHNLSEIDFLLDEVATKFQLHMEQLQVPLLNKIAATNDSCLILYVLKDWPFSENELLKTMTTYFERNPDRIQTSVGLIYECALKVLDSENQMRLKVVIDELLFRNLKFREVFKQRVSRRFLEEFDCLQLDDECEENLLQNEGRRTIAFERANTERAKKFLASNPGLLQHGQKKTIFSTSNIITNSSQTTTSLFGHLD